MKNRLLEIKDLIRKDEVNTAIMLLENYISRKTMRLIIFSAICIGNKGIGKWR